MIKAIETKYGGCRFRSRTEARWAVMFDALGIKWQYELEGFELPSGRYLPDFYIPEFETWIEVKGGQPNKRELTLAAELADQSEQLVLIVCGIPEVDGEQVWMLRPQRMIVRDCLFASRGNALTNNYPAKGRKTLWLNLDKRDSDRIAVPTEFLRSAIVKARSAQFEHGEKGTR